MLIATRAKPTSWLEHEQGTAGVMLYILIVRERKVGDGGGEARERARERESERKSERESE